MYKIEISNIEEIKRAYFDKYSPIVKDLMNSLLDGCVQVDTTLGESKKCKVIIEPGTSGFLYDFLKKATDPKDDSFIKKLLIGNFREQLDLIKDVSNDTRNNFRPLSKNKYSDTNKCKDGDVFTKSDFHYAMDWIFVQNMFDGKENSKKLNKSELIDSLNLSVCPYCANEDIYPTSKKTKDENDVVVNPQLDHFLPKSKYPFLAMNFHNLIPCGSHCNLAPNKGEWDPIGDNQRNLFLLNPYEFIDSAFYFTYNITGSKVFDEKSFQIGFQYSPKFSDLRYGFTHIIAIESLYERKQSDVYSLYKQIVSDSDVAKEWALKMGCADSYWRKRSALNYLGFEIEPHNAMLRKNYKFKKDIFTAMFPKIRETKEI